MGCLLFRVVRRIGHSTGQLFRQGILWMCHGVVTSYGASYGLSTESHGTSYGISYGICQMEYPTFGRPMGHGMGHPLLSFRMSYILCCDHRIRCRASHGNPKLLQFIAVSSAPLGDVRLVMIVLSYRYILSNCRI